MILDDEPISSIADDNFAREPLARSFARTIGDCAGANSSTVFAVVGPWGSGKTSLLNLTCLELGDSLAVVKFNPWLVSSVEALLADFFATLLELFEGKPKLKGVAGTLRRYAKVAARLGSFGPTPIRMLSVVVETVAEQPEAGLTSLRADVEGALKDCDQPVLVVVDDIDRLQPDELLALLKVIRLVGRLPNVHYLLAFDEQSVLDLLTASSSNLGEERGTSFLEKIVQVRIDVPPLHRSEAIRLAKKCLDQAIDGPTQLVSPVDRERLDAVISTVLCQRFDQPRRVMRIFAQLAQSLPLVVHEVDVVDLLLLIHLRLTWPSLYGQLAKRRETLTNNVKAAIAAHFGDEQSTKTYWEDQLGLTKLSEPEHALEVLCELFPPVARAHGKSSPDSDSLYIGRRIGSEYYFDRYFQLGVPADDISDAEVRVEFQLATEAEGNPGRLIAMLNRSPQVVYDKVYAIWRADGRPSTPGLISVIMGWIDSQDRPDGKVDLVDVDLWLAQLVLAAGEGMTPVIEDVLSSRRGLYHLVRGISYGFADRIGDSNCPLIVELIERSLLEKLRVDTASAITDDRLPWCLQYFSRLNRRDTISMWLEEILDRTAWRTADFIACFVPVSTSVTGRALRSDLAFSELHAILPIPRIAERLAQEIDAHEQLQFDDTDFDISLDNRRRRGLILLARFRRDRLNEVPQKENVESFAFHPSMYIAPEDHADLELRCSIVLLGDKPAASLKDVDKLERELSKFANRIGDVITLLTTERRLPLAVLPTLLGGSMDGLFRLGNGSASSVCLDAALDRTGKSSVPVAVTVTLGLRFVKSASSDITDPVAESRQIPFSLGDLVGAVDFVIRCAEVLTNEFTVSDDREGAHLRVWVTGSSDPLTFVKADGLDRIGETNAGELSVATKWPLPNPVWETDGAKSFAKRVVATLLRRNGYRSFEAQLER